LDLSRAGKVVQKVSNEESKCQVLWC